MNVISKFQKSNYKKKVTFAGLKSTLIFDHALYYIIIPFIKLCHVI